MKRLGFARVMVSANSDAESLFLENPGPDCPAVELVLASDGRLQARPHVNGSKKRRATRDNEQVVALLHAPLIGGRREWQLVPFCDELGLNGVTPPFPLVQLDAGSLLSIGQRFWLTVWHWTPSAVSAPPELADKTCPICGGKLSLVPVLACSCGNRWMHLEKPEEPDNPDVLNCFLEARECGDCHRPTTLEPRLVPELPEKLDDRFLADAMWDCDEL